MKTTPVSRFNHIEALENRIAPAGLVTVIYNAGTGELTLTGDNANNSVNLIPTGTNTHRVEGVLTSIGTPGVSYLDIGKLTKLTMVGGDGSDTFTLHNLTKLKALSFTGGIGDDDLVAEGIVVKGSVALHGNAGGDSVIFSGLSTAISGNVTIDSAATATDSMSVGFQATKTVIGGSVLFTGGGASDFLGGSGEGRLSIGKGVNFNAGAGGGSVDLISADRTSVGKLASGESILYTGGAGDDSLALGSSKVTLTGGIRMTGGNGINEINFNSGGGSLKIGKLASGQSILFNGGTANDDINSDLAQATLSGGIEFNGAGGDNVMGFDDGGVVKFGKFGSGQSVLFTGTTDASNELFLGGFVTLKGSVEVVGGSGSDGLDLDGKVSIGKNAAGVSVSLIGGGDDDDIDLQDSIALAGSLKFDGGNGDDDCDLTEMSTLVVKGTVEVTGGLGEDSFNLDAVSLKLGKSLTVTGGDDADFASINADGTIKGDVSFDLGLSAVGSQLMIIQGRSGQPFGLALKGSLAVESRQVVRRFGKSGGRRERV